LKLIKKVFRYLPIALFLVLQTKQAYAAIELEKVKGENSYTIKISKSVHFDDVEKFQAVVDEVKKRKFTLHMNAIQLDVHGGEPSAARAIGRIIRKNKFNTFVAPTSDCVSACRIRFHYLEKRET
jgi:hypothetical protein